jgi:DNA helicase-2/ATP-dependent DNA helicase PcrA
MRNLQIDIKQYNPLAVQNLISSAKNQLINEGQYPRYISGYFQERVAKIYPEYQKRLKQINALDFDDLISKTVELFQKYPDVLVKYQNLFQYILVDEYQDTNQAQYTLINLLASAHKNICVVGDDYQAIYGWRGANYQNILDFEKDYPNAEVIKMEQNYRSTKNIIAAANEVISKNILRTDKNLWTNNKEGLPATIYRARDELEETDFIAREIEAMKLLLGYNSFAILYRTNAQSRVLEEIMLRYEIPYRIVGAVQFYQRKEIKDILAYLKLVINPQDEISFKRIVNTPPRGIGPKTIQAGGEKIDHFWDLVGEIKDKSIKSNPSDLIDFVARISGYKDYVLDGSEEGEMRWENIEELKSVASEEENLGEFLEKVSLVSDVDNYDSQIEAVTLMTLHNAKGLEFPVVFMVGMEEGIFPHSRSMAEPAEMEEERRLCYVGMTRAKERLYMTYAESRMLYGSVCSNVVSRFLKDIPNHLIEEI